MRAKRIFHRIWISMENRSWNGPQDLLNSYEKYIYVYFLLVFYHFDRFCCHDNCCKIMLLLSLWNHNDTSRIESHGARIESHGSVKTFLIWKLIFSFWKHLCVLYSVTQRIRIIDQCSATNNFIANTRWFLQSNLAGANGASAGSSLARLRHGGKPKIQPFPYIDL